MYRFEMIAAVLAILCTAMLTACSSNEEQASGNTGTYIHPGSQIPFPHMIAGFVRQRVTEASPDGSGTKVVYLLSRADAEISAAVFVYRNPDAKPAEAQAQQNDGPPKSEAQDKRLEFIKREIIKAGSDDEHRFIAAYDIAIERGGKPYYGKRAYFRDRDKVFSNAYLFEYGRWFVEYRMVFARDLEWIAEQFVNEHLWDETAATDDER